jgi:hypothetical protein
MGNPYTLSNLGWKRRAVTAEREIERLKQELRGALGTIVALVHQVGEKDPETGTRRLALSEESIRNVAPETTVEIVRSITDRGLVLIVREPSGD